MNLHYPRVIKALFPEQPPQNHATGGTSLKLLPRDRRVDLYFHLLRLNHYPVVKSAA